MHSKRTTLLAFEDMATAQLLAQALSAAEHNVLHAQNYNLLRQQISGEAPLLLILEAYFDGKSALDIAADILAQTPTLPIIIYSPEADAAFLRRALQTGIADVLTPPLTLEEIQRSVEATVQRAFRLGDWLRNQIHRSTALLQRHSEALETLLKLGRQITGSLEIDDALTQIVSAAVNLLKAEEGTLLLADPDSGELYIRASKNFNQQLVETLRLPVHDSLAGQVIKSGQPLTLSSENAKKIKTSYLVHSLIYVPLHNQEQVIGVLGVDNRTINREFSDEAVTLLSILADYAVIALQNAQLYEIVRQERNKLDAVFRNIKNGVIIIDQEKRILFVNPAARQAFHIKTEQKLEGLPVYQAVQNADLEAMLQRKNDDALTYHEINTDDGQIYSAQYTPIPELGAVITLHNITYLKDLDKLKTDFIHTVSHDLRSPLTAVLGYAELLERVGSLTPQQEEFVRRIQMSVTSITELVNDLLDLGRIESGFDMRKELVNLEGVLSYVLDGLQILIQKKEQVLQLQIADDIPPVRGNPIRLRQMMDNLIGNAIKYTPKKGKIVISLFRQDDQIIFEVSDNGPGIPVEDQPHIFEKFYRAENTQAEGTGLGLAIVKSIVDSHQGRIWVNSTPGQGATFTVVLPIDHTES